MTRHQPAAPGELRPGEDIRALVRSKSDQDRQRLQAAPPEQLASALEALRPRKTAAELQREEDADDWAVPTEVIDPEDRTLGEDGALE